jgi:hypothetical protein
MSNQADPPLTLILENNLILNNLVIEGKDGFSGGGGVYLGSRKGGYIVRNNIVAKNMARGATGSEGGGIHMGWHYNDIMHLSGNTINGNQADKGGGVYFLNGNLANVYNNIIYGNTAIQGGDLFLGSVGSNGFNNNYSNMNGTWTLSGENLDMDPLFVDPSNNDFHLLPASPMKDKGTMAVPFPPGLMDADFEGNPRIIGTAPDIGAYELGAVSVTPAEGTMGTEIEIYGIGFGTKKNKILIGTMALRTLLWTDGWIRASLNKALPPGVYDITIQPKGASSIVLEGAFTVKAPEIGSVEPGTGSVNDEITIQGLFFGTTRGKVTLGGKNCRIKTWTSEIHIVVPRGLNPGTHELKISNGVGSDTTNFIVD